jgi:hypothetical protein
MEGRFTRRATTDHGRNPVTARLTITAPTRTTCYPDGMTVNISKITTRASVDVQANAFDKVSGMSMDDTLLTSGQ